MLTDFIFPEKNGGIEMIQLEFSYKTSTIGQHKYLKQQQIGCYN